MPYYDAWFKNSKGEVIQRSVYEYLRDYLGYVLMLDNLQIKNVGDNTKITFVVTNYGLGTPLTIRNMEVVVGDKVDGNIDYKNVKSYYVQSYDCKTLITYSGQKITLTLKGDFTNKAIGVKLSRGNYPIKIANDTKFSNGVNWIC